jgi:hypothetical protein
MAKHIITYKINGNASEQKITYRIKDLKWLVKQIISRYLNSHEGTVTITIKKGMF